MTYRSNENDRFHHEILPALDSAWRQGADVGEVPAAASATSDGDAGTWLSTWSAKELVPFSATEGAHLHCEPMGRALLEQRVFDWLDARLSEAEGPRT